jgi:hypothetical protein
MLVWAIQAPLGTFQLDMCQIFGVRDVSSVTFNGCSIRPPPGCMLPIQVTSYWAKELELAAMINNRLPNVRSDVKQTLARLKVQCNV